MQQKLGIFRSKNIAKKIHHFFFSFTLLLVFVFSAAEGAGYSCPTYKKYTSCSTGYYISNCGTNSTNWNGQTISSSSLTTGNSCNTCPSNYTCSGGLACPKASTVRITYNLNGGNGAIPSQTFCAPGKSCSLNNGYTTSFYRAGYVLVGWSTNKTATSGSFTITPTTNLTVYAIWKPCSGATYKTRYAQARAGCTNCPTGYISNITNGKESASECAISCRDGYYLAESYDQSCSPVGAGYYRIGHSVLYGNHSDRYACPDGLTTIGYGFGANEEADCGRVLNIGDKKIYLRSARKTLPSLNVNINGDVFYGSLSPESKGSLRINYSGQTYSVYDDSM